MEGAAADGVRVTVDAAWSDDRKVLCYLEDPANPAAVTEQLETEKDAQELFTQRARQVDFFKFEQGRAGKGDEEGAEARTREAQKKREERMRLEATRRDAIFARMRHAMGEMELMFGFIDMAQRGEHLATALIQKQPPPVSRAVDSQAFTILAKQKQLEKAAADLTKAATRLRTLVAREKRYSDELLALRKEVKLRGRPPRAIVAEYAIPCSSGGSGSSADACEVDLRKTRTGEVVVHMAPSRIDKSLRIVTTHQHATYSLPLTSQGREDAEEATGATATIALLSRALRSQFCTELFRELSEGVSEATRQGQKSEWWWWASHAHVFENEITFYDATIRARPLSIRLASSRTAPPDGTEWVEGMGEEDALAVHHFDEDDHKDGEGNIADTLTVLLFKLWRQHQDELLRLQINPAPPTPPSRRVGIRMANALFDTFRHHCLRQRLHARLSALCASTPFLATHWFLSPKSPTVSSFNVLFASSLVVHVVVDGIKIVCGSAKPIFSDEEFIEYLLMQLSHRLLGDLHQAAMQEGRPVEKHDLSLLFQSLADKATTVFHAQRGRFDENENKTREVSLVPLAQSHQLQIMQKVMIAEEDHAAVTAASASAAGGRGSAGKELGAGDKGVRGATASQSVVTSHHFFPLTSALGGAAGGPPASSSRRDATYAVVLQRWLHLAATER